MRNVKRSHAQAGLVRLYAAEKGIPLRTAQYHAQKQNADYLAFVARMGVQAIKAEKPTAPQRQALMQVIRGGEAESSKSVIDEVHIAPPAMSIPREKWTPEQYAECEAWVGLVEANAQRQAALARSDPMAALGYVNLAATMLKSYHFARQKRVAADIEAGRLKPMAAWQSAKAALQKVVALLVSMEGELAQTSNPNDPLFARKAIGDWKERKWNPAVRAVMEELAA